MVCPGPTHTEFVLGGISAEHRAKVTQETMNKRMDGNKCGKRQVCWKDLSRNQGFYNHLDSPQLHFVGFSPLLRGNLEPQVKDSFSWF